MIQPNYFLSWLNATSGKYSQLKSIQTRKVNNKELANLLKVFVHMPIDAIAPMHVREYMDIRGQTAKVRANREKA